MLREIMDMLEQEKTVLPREIAARLNSSEESVRLALEQLARIGALRVTVQSTEGHDGCGNCPGCGGKTNPASCSVAKKGNAIKWYEPV